MGVHPTCRDWTPSEEWCSLEEDYSLVDFRTPPVLQPSA